MAPAHPGAGGRRRGSLRVTGGLKNLADAKKYRESLLLGPAQEHVMAKEARDHSRRQDIIHPSEIAQDGWCPLADYRRILHVRDGGTWEKKSFGFQALNIFEHGNVTHTKWQTWLWEMGWLWGTWHCHNCETYWSDLAPQQCPVCERRHLSYAEVDLDLTGSLLIAGNADGAIPHLNTLVEVKTVGSGTLRYEAPELLRSHTHRTRSGKDLIDAEGLWRGITRPFPAHLRQGQIYLHLAQELGLPYTQMTYLYESKFNQGTKEFTVKYRESTALPLIEKAAPLQRAVEQGGPEPTCPHGGCTHCEKGNPNEPTSPPEPPQAPRRRRPRLPGSDPPGSP